MRENTDFPPQKPQQLSSAEANLEGRVCIYVRMYVRT